MMKFKICFVHDDHEDSIIIEGESIEDLQKQAERIIQERQPDDYWSEEVL